MKKFNLSSIMHSAWKFVKKLNISISAALRLAWQNAKTTADAKKAAEITEEVHTYSGWLKKGYEVIHGSKAAFQITAADPRTKSGSKKLSYFTASQVQPVQA